MSDTVLQEVFLGRQPILDRKQQLFAYELLFRSSKAEDGNFASFVDGNQATAMVITHAFTEFSMAVSDATRWMVSTTTFLALRL